MTSGERAVWAAEFTRMLVPRRGGPPSTAASAAAHATKVVLALRRVNPDKLDDDTQAMLADMLGMRT